MNLELFMPQATAFVIFNLDPWILLMVGYSF